MSHFFADLWDDLKSIAYGVVFDALGLPTRPVALIISFLPGKYPMLEVLVTGGLFPKIVIDVSLVLIMISLGVIFACCCDVDKKDLVICLFKMVTSLFVADGLAQLPTLLHPQGHILPYSVSMTGIFALGVQVQVGLGLIFCPQSQPDGQVQARLNLISCAVPLRYMCLALVEPGGPTSWALYIASIICLIFAVTPKIFWKLMWTALEKACEFITYLGSLVYIVFAYICPKLQECVVYVLQLPCTLWLYHRVIVPCWECLSPWCLPLAMSAVAYSCYSALMKTASLQDWPMAAGTIFCGTAAAISVIVLALHAGLRMCRREQPDPLKLTALVYFLSIVASGISLPWRLLCRVHLAICIPCLLPLLWDVLWCIGVCLGHLGSFAFHCPFLSIPLILAANGFLLWYLATHPNVFGPFGKAFQAFGAYISKTVLHTQTALAAGAITDSALVIVFIIVVQVLTYALVADSLAAVRAVRRERTGDVLGLDELNELAAAMAEPRQCGRCGFGPVDHRGCSDLSTHHMEVRVNGGRPARTSNACPRCGWFTGRLSDWPDWDGEMQSPRGRALFRQRVWCEIVVIVRASSKALLVPYVILVLGDLWNLPPLLSALLALSYLIPWAIENVKLSDSLFNPRVYRRTPQPRRRPAALAAGVEAGDGADCGAMPTTPLLPNITQSEALANIMSGSPDVIFLKLGDACSVCLDEFSAEAASTVAKEPVAQACQKLLKLTPPVVALRCGHALHVECAEAAVAAGGARHVRCPLCREPVTFGGATTAVLFS